MSGDETLFGENLESGDTAGNLPGESLELDYIVGEKGQITDSAGNPYYTPAVPIGKSTETSGFSLDKLFGNLLGSGQSALTYAQNNPLQAALMAALAYKAMTGGDRPSTAGYKGGINMGRVATRIPSNVPKFDLYGGKPVYGPTGGGITYAAEGGLMGLARGGSLPPRYLRGETDGMADKLPSSIDGQQPAKLSHGEFVIPADVVSHLGNGNSDAGAKVLYKMMDRVRQARTGTKRQGKRINPEKFTPGGIASGYAGGGAVAFAEGGVPSGTSTTSNLSEWAGPYVTDYLSKARALAELPYQSFSDWSGGAPISAGTSPLQEQAFQGLAGLQLPGQFGAATDFLTQAGQRAGAFNYTPQNITPERINAPNIQNLSMQAAAPVSAQQYSAPQMSAQTTGYQPGLQTFQMGPAERVSTQGFDTSAAQGLMSPYMRSVIDIQKREAQRQADIASTARGAKYAQAGAFGGARQAIENAEAQRNLSTQMGDIEAKGLQEAYQQAQQQFNTEQQRSLAAQQANQQAGLSTGQQNLAAQLGVQQLGTQAGLQTALANLNNQQQAAVQNQAAQLQTQGMNAQQALQAALANQQNQQQANLQNLSAGLQTQGLQAQTGLEAQRANQQTGLQALLANQQAGQFGANLGLQANQQLMGAGTALGGLGQGMFGTQLQGLNALLGAGGTQQQTAQQGITALQNEYNKQMMWPYQQLQFQQSMMQGLPVSTYANTLNTSTLQNVGNAVSGIGSIFKGISGLTGP